MSTDAQPGTPAALTAPPGDLVLGPVLRRVEGSPEKFTFTAHWTVVDLLRCVPPTPRRPTARPLP